MTELPRPLWADLTDQSSRAEVLAAVAAADQRRRVIEARGPGEHTPCFVDRAELEHWDRTEVGDVTNLRAFDRHLATVGEENQDAPGWDTGP